MRILSLIVSSLLLATVYGQDFQVGFKTLKLKDSSRIYKPSTSSDHPLHYRPVEIDIWYPSRDRGVAPMTFGDLFQLFEERAVLYQEEEDYSGITEELAQFYVAELGVGGNGQKLLGIKTNTYSNLTPFISKDSSSAGRPVIIYMAGFNGMGFENYRILEELAQSGYVVIAMWSVGRYPGNMTNAQEDMMQQVQDAEFALNHMKENSQFGLEDSLVGVLACSWGGMSAAVLIHRNPGITSFVSYDGTETHYFGEDDENDRFIQKIYDSGLVMPETQEISYLYFESGDKLDEFRPERVYNYFEKLDSEKYYLRFTNSTHADFTCIPSILEASQTSVKVYSEMQKATLEFFDKTLRNKDDFSETWKKLKIEKDISLIPLEISTNTDSILEISGKVTDAKTGEGIPYVNIGIPNRERGTVTDSLGNFLLELDEDFGNDTLRISSIGYQSQDLLIPDLAGHKSISVSLQEHIGELNEIVIPVRGLKQKTLGNKTESRFMSTGFSYDQLGAEMGVRINVRRQPTYVDAFNFFISYNRLSARSIFRLNFYSVEKGKPHRNLLNENILVRIDPKETGPITVDLESYDILLRDDVIVTLEWVENEGENNKGEAIFFSLAIFNSGTLYKKSSQARFKKYSNLGVGFNIDVRY